MAASTRPNAATELGDSALVITRAFDAPRGRVFEAWTRKEQLERWCVPRGFTILHSEGELRPGGAWRCCMRSPDGVEHRVGGTYREIVENELLVFTHAWEDARGRRDHQTVVTVRFAGHGDRTKLAFHQAAFESAEAREGHARGWAECFDRLADHLARVPAARAAGRAARDGTPPAL